MRESAQAFGAVSLDAFGVFSDAEAVAAALALDYVRLTQAGNLPRLSRPVAAGLLGEMMLDAATRASLEITRPRDSGARDGGGHTLLAAVDRTMTAPGARLLATWLAGPLLDPAEIATRQDGWAWLLGHPALLDRLRSELRGVPDLARALGRLGVGRGTPRDLGAIRAVLQAAAAIVAAITDAPLPLAALALDPALQATLERALADPLPARLDDGGVIAAGFDGELDAERALRDDSRRVVAGMALDYAQRFGVASIKIRHHAQLGYVIEAPTQAVEKLRADPALQMRQAMTNGARFTTAELADLDRRIGEAAERAAARETLVFAALVAEIMRQAEALAGAAMALAELDVLQACARLAEGGRWCRPRVTNDAAYTVKGLRHPVVEKALGSQAAFVPNDCDLSPARRLLLLTGPNMAGKSTFLRQNALAVVLAQAGLPVPAESADIGIVDRLFRPRGGGGRSGARAQHVHGRDDGNGLDPASGRAALVGGGRRDRPGDKHAGRAGDRVGGTGGVARADPVPDDLRHAFPRTRQTGPAVAPSLRAHDAGQGMAGQRRVPARGGRGCGRALVGRACGAVGRGSAGDGAAGGRAAVGVGEERAWAAGGVAAVRHAAGGAAVAARPAA